MPQKQIVLDTTKSLNQEMPQKQTVLDTTKLLKREMPQKTTSSGYNQITQS